MFAARNVKLCTKDCMCLFVCPTGATDTENGQIDSKKCLDGCRLCVDSCPSGAIYLVYDRFASPRVAEPTVAAPLRKLAGRRGDWVVALESIKSEDKSTQAFIDALAHSLEVAGEDYIRETGFLHPCPESIENLSDSRFVSAVYSSIPGAAETIDRLLAEAAESQRNNRDGAPCGYRACTGCGTITDNEQATECPQCGGSLG